MQTNNMIFLRGRLAAPPAFSHSNHGVEYLVFPLSVRRLSGAEDRLNVVVSREQLEGLDEATCEKLAGILAAKHII